MTSQALSTGQLLWRLAQDLSAEPPASAPVLSGTGRDSHLGDGWGRLLYWADLHTVTPLLFQTYRDAGWLGGLPSTVVDRLRQTYDHTRSRASWMMPEFHKLLESLSAVGMDFLILKGFPLIDRLYGDRGARPTYDIDLWLRDPADSDRALEALRGLGYETLPETADDHGSDHRHLAPLWKPAPRAAPGDYFNPRLPWTVELHVTLWESHWWGLRLRALPELWERRTVVSVDGYPTPVLGEADQLVYLAMHQVLHIIAGNGRLIHLQDLHRLCQLLRLDRWQSAWERASVCELEVYLAAAVLLTQAIFKTPVPEHMQAPIDQAIAGRAVGTWLNGAAAQDVLLQDWTVPHRSRYQLAWLSALFARRLWHKPWAFAQPLLKTMLPSSAFVRRKYDLPPSRPVLPYYVPHVLGGIRDYARQGLRRLLERG